MLDFPLCTLPPQRPTQGHPASTGSETLDALFNVCLLNGTNTPTLGCSPVPHDTDPHPPCLNEFCLVLSSFPQASMLAGPATQTPDSQISAPLLKTLCWASDTSLVPTSPVSTSCRSSEASNPACQFVPQRPSILSASLCILESECNPSPAHYSLLLGMLDQVWQHSHPEYAPRPDVANHSTVSH